MLSNKTNGDTDILQESGDGELNGTANQLFSNFSEASSDLPAIIMSKKDYCEIGRRNCVMAGSLRGLLIVAVVVIVILVIVIGALISLFFFPSFTTGKKSFSYEEHLPTGAARGSLRISDVNGDVKLLSWNGSTVLINGSITSSGYNSKPDDITIQQSDSGGNIAFVAKFPQGASFLDRSYTVNIFVYLPTTGTFTSATIETVNGMVNISPSLNASDSISISTVNGVIVTTGSLYSSRVTASTVNGDITCQLTQVMDGGSYSLTSVNGALALNVPKESSFRLSASTVNGNVQTSGLTMTNLTQSGSNRLTATLGNNLNSSASVRLSAVNGGITVAAIS